MSVCPRRVSLIRGHESSLRRVNGDVSLIRKLGGLSLLADEEFELAIVDLGEN